MNEIVIRGHEELTDSQSVVMIKWFVQDGGHVKAGDDVGEVETDKADIILQAEADGALNIIVQEGEVVTRNTVFGTIVPFV